MTQAHPLQWPVGRPRTKRPERSRFKITRDKARQELIWEIQRLGGKGLIISSNVPRRRDGHMYSDRMEPDDRGVAVYFSYQGRQVCFACDRWDRVRDNLQAIHHTIDALRGIARWGTGDMMEAAFTGFEALPPPESCWGVLDVAPDADSEAIESAFRAKAKHMHPDVGGSTEAMQRLQAARATALEARK